MSGGVSLSARAALFANGGEMGRRIIAHDWSASAIGPIGEWPEALVNAVSLLLPTSAEIVLFWGPDYVALYNDAYAPTIGLKHPGALGCPASRYWAELWDDLEPLLAHVRTTGETYRAKDRPFYIERAGYGEEVYFDISYSPVRLADGSVGGVLCIVAETTERVRAARAIAEDRARLSEMFDSAPGFMAVLRGPNHLFELANRSYHRLIGERHGDIIGRRLRDVLPEIEGQGYVELLDRVLATGEAYRADGARVMFERDSGEMEERFVDFVFQPLTDGAGATTGVFVEGIDATERHRAEQALQLSRESLHLANEAAEIGTWDLDVVTAALRWTPLTKKMFGISPEAEVGLDDFYAALHPDDLAPTKDAFMAAMDPAVRALYDVEYRVIGVEDGVTRWIAAKGRGLFDESGRCARAIGTTIDITQRKLQAETLRESEERFRQMADSAPALIWVSDATGNLTFANRWFQTMLGISDDDIRRDGWTRIVPKSDLAAIGVARDTVRRQREGFGGDMRVIDAQGEVRWIHIEGRPRFNAGVFHGFVGCGIDITESHLAGEMLERRIDERTSELRQQIAERERVEATLHQMQRLEAVGQLTSGVAHDFNNLLTVVLGNVGMIERAARGGAIDPRSLRRLEHIRTAAERGAALTAQLLAFSRRQRLEARALDLNETVLGMRDLMATSLGGAIAIETRLAPDLWPALVDGTQIELVILNLALNARDAMGAAGTLTLTTANVQRGEPARTEEPPPGDHVMVAVSDTGGGMTADVLAKAFEPFFTTKEVGKGSGLGLAQVYGFVKQSGGGVRIDSAPGEGTRVSVYLPRAADAAAQDATPPIVAATGSIAGRTVLVLDDDDAVRGVTADELREAGCRVIEAADGAAALDALEAEPGIEAVIADFAMPGMNGVEFADHARARYGALPIVFVTGYADLSALAHIAEERIVQKPYPPGAIAARLRGMLER